MNHLKSPDDDRREPSRRPTMARPIAVSDEDEREFQLAMEGYKRRSGRMFPTWSEILEVLRSIGYAKRIWRPVEDWSSVSPASIPGLPGADDSSALFGWFATVETPVGP